MNLNEAEIQVLAQLHGAETESESTDRRTLEQRGKGYWIYVEDWSGAFSSLVKKALIDGDDEGYRLTASGRPEARAYYEERPDLYWYHFQRLYEAAFESEAHREFCRRMYGQDLRQENMTDMSSLDDVLQKLNLKSGDHLLDLGCGAGGIAEYIADRTGAAVTGIDYSATAIATATARTEDKRLTLKFLQADINTLDLPAHSFDAAISIDSIYWVADMTDAIRRISGTVKSGGQLAILIVQIPAYCENPEDLEIDGTPVAKALQSLKLDYQGYDQTEEFRGFWPRVKKIALELREDYEREGNSFICDNYIREADTEFLPAIEANEIRRYLYHMQV